MLIPSIDLQNGHVVQLVQGDRLAIQAPDPEPWIAKFSRFPRVQLIDLDAAMGRGDNAPLVADICRRLPCRVGGGIRSVDRAGRCWTPERTQSSPAPRSSVTAWSMRRSPRRWLTRSTPTA
jgi:phosphoribosylformimino-5-aminoimidazole carboxamide ribonucleotide (ProFAR) isomerase